MKNRLFLFFFALALVCVVALFINNLKRDKTNLARTDEPTKPATKTVPLPQETDVIGLFFSLIDENRPGEAVGMMSAKAAPDDSARQAWAVQFDAFDSLKIISVEPSMQDSWTETVHSYKVILDVKMKPDASSAQPIPNFGWDNGRNTRWVSLSKAGDRWMIDSLATGP